MVTAPILAYPNQKDPFILDTDASDVAIGAVLSQQQAGIERVIAYGSKALSKGERNYCVTRRELLAVVHFVETYRYYLYGRSVVRTDHGWLAMAAPSKGASRPVSSLDTAVVGVPVYNRNRPGKRHRNADGMSRKCFRGGECFHPAPGSEEAEAPPGTVTTLVELTGEPGSVIQAPSPEHRTADGDGPVLSPRPMRQVVSRRAERLAGVQAVAQLATEPHAQGKDAPGDCSPAKSGQQLGAAVPRVQRASAPGRAKRRGRRAKRDQSRSPDRSPRPASQERQGLPAGLTIAHLIERQREDPDLSVLRAWLEQGLPRPATQEISHLSAAIKY